MKPYDRIPIQQAMAEAQTTFREWLAARDLSARLVVFCHFDADGLSAGVLFVRGLHRMGFSDVQIMSSQRGENVFFDEAARTRVEKLAPTALIVTDLGVNERGVLPGLPTLYVDHHRPEGLPPGTVISGYYWEPIPTSAWLAYALISAEIAIEDLAWIAAIGIIGDLGDKAPWPHLAATKKHFTAKWIKEAVVLINAARRAPAFDVATALQLLLEADHPRDISEGKGADRLAAYRAQVYAAVQQARKAAPIFSTSMPFALIKMHSACQIHPLIAQQWRGRLPQYAVIAANTGYLPGTVAFSSRTRREDLRLPEVYADIDLGTYNDDFGHGHDEASGGHLPPQAFNQLLDELGFDEKAHVQDNTSAPWTERRGSR